MRINTFGSDVRSMCGIRKLWLWVIEKYVLPPRLWISGLPTKTRVDPVCLKSLVTVLVTSGILPKTEIRRTGGILSVFPSLNRYVLDKLSFPETNGIERNLDMVTHASTALSKSASDSSSGNGHIKLSI